MSTGGDTVPSIPDESSGSSVSTRLQDEYENLLKYALVTPTSIFPDSRLSGDGMNQTLTEEQLRLHRFSNPSSYGTAAVTADEVSTQQTSGLMTEGNTPESDGFLQTTNTTEGELRHESEIENKVFGNMRYVPPVNPAAKTTSLDDLDEDEKSDSVVLPAEKPEESLEAFHDNEIAQLEMHIDSWNSKFKQNLIEELSHMRMRMFQGQRDRILEEQQKYKRQIMQLARQNEDLKEILANYDRNLGQKDTVIKNLSTTIGKQKSKESVMRSFSAWKLRYSDEKREEFASNLAYEFYQRKLLTRSFRAWQRIKENKWMARVERACQNRAQEVCEQLTREYEERIGLLVAQLDEAHLVIEKLKADRENFEERMKKGFMRGVCALNLEAMTMFKEDEQQIKENVEPLESNSIPPVTKTLPVQSEHPLPRTTTIPVSAQQSKPPHKPLFVRMIGNSDEPASQKPRTAQVVIEKHNEEKTVHKKSAGLKPKKRHQNMPIKIVE